MYLLFFSCSPPLYICQILLYLSSFCVVDNTLAKPAPLLYNHAISAYNSIKSKERTVVSMKSKNAKFLRKLVFLYSTIILTILITGVYLYNLSIENVSKEIKAQNHFMLEKTIHDMDSSLRRMEILAGQMVENSNIVYLANQGNNQAQDFYLRAYHAMDDLSVYGLTQATLPINDAYIYLRDPNFFLSSSIFQESYFFYVQKYTPAYYNDFMQLVNDGALNYQFIALDDYKRSGASVYLYMMPLENYTLKNIPASLCFEIDHNKLSNIFSELHTYDDGFVFVTDSNNRPIFTLSQHDDNAVSKALEADLLKLHDAQGISEATINEHQMLITNSRSTYNDWNYFLVQPKDDALYSLNQYRNIFFSILGLSLLISVFLFLFLSRTSMKRFTQLGTELENTLTHQEHLQELVENQKPLIMDTYLHKIIEGNISRAEELAYAQEYLDIPSNNQKFAILHLVIYLSQYELQVDNSMVTGPDTLHHKEIIEDALSDYFDEPPYILSINEREYTLLLSCPLTTSKEESTSYIKQQFLALHDDLIKNYSIWTFAGLGDWNEGLMPTWKSFQQAKQAISYTTKKSPMKIYQSITEKSPGFYYPIELTRQLTNFVTTGNTSQILEIFEVIRHENMEVRSLPIHMIQYLLTDIRNTLFKIRFDIKGNEEHADALQAIDSLFDQHMSLKLCEDIALHLGTLFEKKTSNNDLIKTIQEYIDANFEDPSLCLSKIADEFPISESYFSYLFKEEMGINFSNYLERKRMERATLLLKDTSLTIQEIYQQVGYNSPHTFRRVFKKIYGMSPNQARKEL